jgi:hypothetical protein
MAAKSSNLEIAGTPLGALAVIITELEWQFTTVNRLWSYFNIYALDAGNAPIGFQWSNVTAGTYNIVPAGMVWTLPVYKIQSYFFKYLTGNCNLYGTCIG